MLRIHRSALRLFTSRLGVAGHGAAHRIGLEMVKRHARKNAANQRRAGTGEGHRQAVEAMRAEPANPYQGGLSKTSIESGWPAVAAGEPVTVRMVDYPVPAPRPGVAECDPCVGTGLAHQSLYTQTGDDGVPLCVRAACQGCLGCGRAEHEQCVPGDHANDDAGEISDYLDQLEDVDRVVVTPMVEGWEPEQVCPSCRGMRFWWLMAFSEPPDGGADADVEVRYLKVPCGCSEDLVREVRRVFLPPV